MNNNTIVMDELQKIPLFAALSENQLESILTSCSVVSLKTKNILFQKNTEAAFFYFLKSGQIKLFSLSADGDEKVIEIINPSQTFAEAIMFMPKQIYPVSAEALRSSEIYCFDMKQFRKILEDSQETCFRLLALLSRRLHSRLDDINNLALHNATYRLVVYLLEQLPEGAMELSSIHLAATKSIIASRLSIQPETFSRIMLRLSKQGFIEVKGNNITLHDVNGLRELIR